MLYFTADSDIFHLIIIVHLFIYLILLIKLAAFIYSRQY